MVNLSTINLAGKYKIATGDYDGIILHFATQILLHLTGKKNEVH